MTLNDWMRCTYPTKLHEYHFDIDDVDNIS